MDFDPNLLDEVKEMYDGYRFGNKDIYSPVVSDQLCGKKKAGTILGKYCREQYIKNALRERRRMFGKRI